MVQMSIEMPEDFKAFIDKKVNDGVFENANDFFQAIVAREVRIGEIENAVLEAEQEYQRGEYTEWIPGSTQKILDEVLRRRQQKSSA